MANPTFNDFRVQFPELVSISDQRVTIALNLVDTLLEENLWAAKDWPKAFLHYAAHLAVMFTLQASKMGATGASGIGGTNDLTTFLSSVSFGERKISFAERKTSGMTGQNDSDIAGEEMLDMTIYGQMYQLLRGRNIMPIVVI